VSNLLILVGSERKKGNSELLSRLAIRRALTYFDRGELIFLRDFNLLPCNGCMACIVGDKACPLSDDFYPLLDRIEWASHLLIFAPTYVLMPPAKLKLLLDRYIAAYPKRRKVKRFGGVGAVIALPEYAQFQLPFLNLFLLAFGFEPVINLEFIGAGPGEVLLDDQLLTKIDKLLTNLSKGEKEIGEGCCPFCLSPLLYYEKGKFFCPICNVPVELRDGIPVYSGSPRWNEATQEDHYQNWILKTRDRFRARLRAILKKKRELSL